MGNVYMEAEQIRYKSASYRNVQEGLDAAFAGSPEGLDERVTALETTVGDNTAGLVKDVDDLETTVGDNTAGLVKDVSDLKTTVGDSTAGLVKDVGDLETTVGDNTAGLVKDVADINNTLNPASFIFSGLSYLHATYVEGGYFRIGKLIVVNIRISADLESDGEINIGNLPLPVASGYAVVGAIVTTTTGVMVGGYINSAGTLVIPDGKVGASYIISATYVERTTPPTP